ncbi:MAG: hypothetical protein PW843_21695 [Azospirillaceae bacterium]|nr:hypothetical protein [Azospirillaceae bacterium]
MTKPPKPLAPPTAPAETPRTLDQVLAEGARKGDHGYGRFRAQADKAAADADKGDDRAYRLLAEAIRGLLRDR